MTKTCVAAAGLYCGFGMSLPLVPTGAGLIGVVLVRGILWSKNQSILWNVLVLGLCMMALFVTVEGSDTSTFMAFWMGVGYGASGVTLIEIGKNFSSGAVKERLGKAWAAFMGTNSSPPGSNPSDPH